MGRWDYLKGTLDKLPLVMNDEDARNQPKVDEIKKKIKEQQTDKLLAMYARARGAYEEKEAEAKELWLKYEAVTQKLIEVFEKKGVASTALNGIGSIRIDTEPYVTVVDKVAWREWCKQNGHEDELTLMWQTSNSLVKNLILDAKEPPSCVKVYLKSKPVFTSNKPDKEKK